MSNKYIDRCEPEKSFKQSYRVNRLELELGSMQSTIAHKFVNHKIFAGFIYIVLIAFFLTGCVSSGNEDATTTEVDTPDIDFPLPDTLYPGIPEPMDTLPSGLMPNLPDPGTQPGWPYDPRTIETPTPTGASEEYIISISGDDTSAGNDGKGTIDAPRRTIPEGFFPAGTKFFIYGDNSPYGTVDFNMGNETTLEFSCSAEEPCWWVGIDTPRIGRRINVENSQHLILEGLSFVDIPGGSRPFGQLALTNSEYITTRHLELRGDGSNSRGASVIPISDSRFVYSYDITIHSAGNWQCDSRQQNESCLDVHGWRPSYRNQYLWLIDSHIYHLQGDSIQTGNSNNSNPQNEVSHYIYIAGNEFYENYENIQKFYFMHFS